MRWFVMLLLFSNVFAAITVTQSAPIAVPSGETVTVTIKVDNTGDEAVDVVVKQSVGHEPVSPEPSSVQIEGYITPQYYLWSETIDEDDARELEFTERINGYGTYKTAPTIVYFKDREEESNSVSIQIVCNKNGHCEKELGEDYISCSADCESGGEDDFCDEIVDKICDPDCEGLEMRADKDCSCGDGVCKEGLENKVNCPVDCKNGKSLVSPCCTMSERDFAFFVGLVVVLLFLSGFVIFIVGPFLGVRWFAHKKGHRLRDIPTRLLRGNKPEKKKK